MDNVETKPLFLILKKKWYDKIASGEKRIEYRRYSEYYFSRIAGKNIQDVIFQLGYSANAPKMKMPVTKICLGKYPDSPDPNDDYFLIHLSTDQIVHYQSTEPRRGTEK